MGGLTLPEECIGSGVGESWWSDRGEGRGNWGWYVKQEMTVLKIFLKIKNSYKHQEKNLMEG